MFALVSNIRYLTDNRHEVPSHESAVHSTFSFVVLGEMRILESQRHKILDQLEKCPSSGDETESPKKRVKYSQEIVNDELCLNSQIHHESSATNSNGKVLDHRDATTAGLSAYTHNHHKSHRNELLNRKTVEIRRLSDCNMKHISVDGSGSLSNVNYSKPNRRTSTDRHHSMESYQASMHKRRKTSATASSLTSSSSMLVDSDPHKSRGVPILNNSFESGGESENESRPGTPLFDERPENSIDPRRPPVPGRPSEPMNLPLPKFAQQFHLQLKQSHQLLPAAHANSVAEKHDNNISSMHSQYSSLKNSSLSPTHRTNHVRSRSNSLMPQNSSGSSNSETALESPRPPSLISNSSDSEQDLGSASGVNISPSLEERLKKFTEDYDSWSSNGRSSSSSHYINNNKNLPEIAVPETPELLKNVLKNSMFDEDSKRLENIGDKYTPPLTQPIPNTPTTKNAFGSFGASHLNLAGTPLTSAAISSLSALSSVPVYPEQLTVVTPLNNSLGKLNIPAQQPVTITTMIHQRLGSSGTGSPLNSPNTASPYNSPNPSSASSISSIKGLQYPFPTHPALSISSVAPPTSSALPNTAPPVTPSSSLCQKPKTACALGKSVSLQEVSPTAISATGNNNNSNTFNSSCNKVSTNNHNDNVNAENQTSKMLVKSASMPNCDTPDVKPAVTEIAVKIEDKKPAPPVSVEEAPKSHKSSESHETKSHAKDRKRNSESTQASEDADEVRVEVAKKESDSSARKESKKSRESEADKKERNESKSHHHKKSRDENHRSHHQSHVKKDEPVHVAPLPKRRVSFEDVSSVESGNEQTDHVIESSKSKHRYHHKEKKDSSKENTIFDDEIQQRLKSNEFSSSKDSLFDELKRNTKDNIIKTGEKIHKSHKHHNRENHTQGKENQTHSSNYNDTSSSVTEDVARSSEDEVIRNHKKMLSDIHEKRHHQEHHQRSRPESSEEGSAKKKSTRQSVNGISTEDSDDSENGNKKTSWFDIPNEAPNISMYDKVKARSCKNLKKQEEEKKIKDKFSALKQSRAKRERKRLNTSDDDSESETHDGNSNDMFSSKFKRSQLSESDQDEGDTDSEFLRKVKNRNQPSVCDDDSSEGGMTPNDIHMKRIKLSGRKMSRTNVIDSTDDEMPSVTDNDIVPETVIKQEPNDTTAIIEDMKKHDLEKSPHNKYNSNGSKKRHHDRSRDDKSSKKSKKLSRNSSSKSSTSMENNKKRDETSAEPSKIASDIETDVEHKNVFTSVEIKKEPLENAERVKADNSVKDHHREESRKRKEKRRRERERQRSIKEGNSVDLDEAGRALEAQLLSDTDQKVGGEDIFRFTDGDDDLKHGDISKKKKKKKRVKDEKNHHHYDAVKREIVENVIESTFHDNNNTKPHVEHIYVEKKPSVPSLTAEIVPLKVAPVVVANDAPVQAPQNFKKEFKIKQEPVIPGFGGTVDDTIHQKAVLSIAKELESKPKEPEPVSVAVKIPEPVVPEVKTAKVDAEKTEEKSRVVISQEETEDAVAALLGESFGDISVEEEYPYDDPIESTPNEALVNAIPAEEDEEMKNAIMSLNPELTGKPDTPQSENELQIDTDEESVDDDGAAESSSQPFDVPPKTPDVDISQVEKEKPSPVAAAKSPDVSPVKEKVETKSPVKKELEIKAEKKTEVIAAATVSKIPAPLKITVPSVLDPSKQFSPITPATPLPKASEQLQSATSKVSPLVTNQTSQDKPEKPRSIISTYQIVKEGSAIQSQLAQAGNSGAKMTPIDRKPNNLAINQTKPKSDVPLQHIVVQQTIGRQAQIIYPPSSEILQKSLGHAEQKPAVEVKETKPEQWQINTNSVIQKTEEKIEEQLKTPHKKGVELDSSHDEDDLESNSSESSRRGRGNGRQARGRKTANVQVTPTKDDPANVQTRRGGKTPSASKRGRGGRAAVTKAASIPDASQIAMPSPAVPTIPHQKSSGPDVYDFHDDSGEEAKSDKTQRPRLVMTIKSTAPATASVNSTPMITSPTQLSSVATITTALPSVTPAIQVVPQQYQSESQAEPQSALLASPNSQQVPSPAGSDDFAQPSNPRKSRRLQEKDGTRTSVDDTIDDVIRNVGPNQAQQAANRRSTRQTASPAAGAAVQPAIAQQQPSSSLPVDMKKPAKTAKKQKDRKVSENSESEVEKKIVEPAGPTASIIVPPQQKQPVAQEGPVGQPAQQLLQSVPGPVQVQVHKQPEATTAQRKTFQKEPSELMQLIDPVTGELQKMTQSKEGQYVPVSENRNQLHSMQIKAIPVSALQQTPQVEAKHEEAIAINPTTIQNIVIASSPLVIEASKKSIAVEPSQVIRPVITQNPTYSKPQPLKKYVLSSQNLPQGVTTPSPVPAASVISSQGILKVNPQHPPTIYNLPNIIPATGAKFIPQQQSQKTGPLVVNTNQPTIIHQVPPQVIQSNQQPSLHQKIPAAAAPTQIVTLSQAPLAQTQQKSTGNLMINIPSQTNVQSAQSPRLQVKQVIQRTLPSQMAGQPIGHGSTSTVVMKTTQPHHVVASNQDLKSQPTYIQQTSSSQHPHDGPPIGYVTANNREIIYVGGTVQKQTIYPNYPVNKFGPNSPLPSSHVLQQVQQQPAKLQEKMQTQPSVSVTHIQNPHQHQAQQQPQKVYFTNSGQVITNTAAGKTAPDTNDRHPRWIPQEKITIQPSQQQLLKNRYVMDNYEDANHHRDVQQDRTQPQSVQSPNLVKRSYVMEGPGSHQLASPSQPIHHPPANAVNQAIIPPQNKTVIGLNQPPQILTGAVASPPLKAHLTSQQPIVTGKS